jgi:hypothetical protein
MRMNIAPSVPSLLGWNGLNRAFPSGVDYEDLPEDGARVMSRDDSTSP